jgi:hypothetical protein
MSLAALIARYKQPPVTPVTEPTLPPQPSPTLAVTPVTPVTPKNTEGQSQKQNPDDLLADIAAMLQADPNQLRALLSADDLDDIAHGRNSRGYMLDYFRQMRTDGKLPTITAPAPQGKPDTTGRAATWKFTHEAMINHLMACSACYAPKRRYCAQGADLRSVYRGG